MVKSLLDIIVNRIDGGISLQFMKVCTYFDSIRQHQANPIEKNVYHVPPPIQLSELCSQMLSQPFQWPRRYNHAENLALRSVRKE